MEGYEHLDILTIKRPEIEILMKAVWADVVRVTHQPLDNMTGICLAHAMGYYLAMHVACPYADLRRLAGELGNLVMRTCTEYETH